MGKKNKIGGVTPKSSADTAPRKKSGIAAGNKRLKREIQARRYAEAAAQGKGEEWLKAHPKAAKRFAAKTGQGAVNRGANQIGGDASDIIKGENKVATGQAQTAIQMQNASTYATPTGSQEVTIGPDGRPVVTQKLSPDQQKILDSGETLTQTGQGKAQDIIGGYKQFAMGDDQRQKVEDAVYARLTKNVDRDFGLEKDQLEQTMYNRGIPLDPTNPQYKQQMDALNEKYAAIKENASNQAVQQGAAEFGQEFSRQLTTHQQGLSDAGTLQSQGTGLLQPNLPGFQAPTMNQTAAGQVATTVRGQNVSKDIANINAKAGVAAAQIAANSDEEEEPPT